MKDKDIEFTFNDFNDYAKELVDIKATYDDLINDKEIQELLRLKRTVEMVTDFEQEYNSIKGLNNREFRKVIENSNWNFILQIIRYLEEQNKKLTEKYLGAVADYETVMSENKHLDEVNCRLRKANEQLKDNWNKLKKYIQNEYKRLHGILETPSEFEMMALLKVFDKMREIEQGNDADENNK